jgi:hypothetical protein
MIAVLIGGCIVTPSTSPPPGDTATVTSTASASTTGDTGPAATADACGAGVARMEVALCAETTADGAFAEPTTGTYYATYEARVSGTVTEIGGALPPVADASRLLAACGPEHAWQVRLVDAAGETWTVGWSVPDAALGPSGEGLALGDTVDLVVRNDPTVFGPPREAILLADAGGPRVLFETIGLLTEAERGGVAAEVHNQDTCLTAETSVDFPMVEHYLVTLSGPAGGVSLRSGQQATIAGARDLDVVVTQAYRWPDCADGCSASEMGAWESP